MSSCPICHVETWLLFGFLCENGHVVCETCASNMTSCPLCRSVIQPDQRRHGIIVQPSSSSDRYLSFNTVADNDGTLVLGSSVSSSSSESIGTDRYYFGGCNRCGSNFFIRGPHLNTYNDNDFDDFEFYLCHHKICLACRDDHLDACPICMAGPRCSCDYFCCYIHDCTCRNDIINGVRCRSAFCRFGGSLYHSIN